MRFLSLAVLASLPLLLSGCFVKKQNTKICSVAGVLSAGMDCSYTLSDHQEEMDLVTSVEFLSPQPKREDPTNPGKWLPARAGAICMSAEDWNKDATTLEQACKGKCGKDVEQDLDEISRRLRKIQALSISKIPAPPAAPAKPKK